MLPRLLRFADRSSMAFSRKVRLSFLDHRIAEYLFAMPETLKINGTTAKVILRRAAQGRIPDKVLHRNDKKDSRFQKAPGCSVRCAAGRRVPSIPQNCGSAVGLIRRWRSKSGSYF
jgi:asparagine synthetase B (glutamine-hydrolysing)